MQKNKKCPDLSEVLRKGCINPKSICATSRTARAQALTRGQKRPVFFPDALFSPISATI